MDPAAREVVIVAYDVAHPGRLRRMARLCEQFGTRVQKSVFECWIDGSALESLQRQAARIVDPRQDRVRYYRLCGNDAVDALQWGHGLDADARAYRVV